VTGAEGKGKKEREERNGRERRKAEPVVLATMPDFSSIGSRN
jgi:hypothetical protein